MLSHLEIWNEHAFFFLCRLNDNISKYRTRSMTFAQMDTRHQSKRSFLFVNKSIDRDIELFHCRWFLIDDSPFQCFFPSRRLNIECERERGRNKIIITVFVEGINNSNRVRSSLLFPSALYRPFFPKYRFQHAQIDVAWSRRLNVSRT